MGRLKKVVLDVLKPQQPNILELARYISTLDGVEGVNITLVEIDRNVESVKITVEGRDVNYDDVERVINENGATVHSLDEVTVGKSKERYIKSKEEGQEGEGVN